MRLVAASPPRALQNFMSLLLRTLAGTTTLFETAALLAAPLLALSACGETDDSSEFRDATGAGGSSAAGSGSGGTVGGAGAAGGAAGSGGESGGAAGSGSVAGSGGTGSACNPTNSGSGLGIPANCEPLNQCLQRACGETYTQCLGQDYANGDYSGGACEATFQCIEACDCEPTCSEQCYQNDQACIGCVVGLFLCGYECEDELEACEG
jgi:hypothetical protein